jgi:hypothetical protein
MLNKAQIAAIHEKDHAPGQGPIAGHEVLTMHDQMRAMGISSKPVTSPVTGAVVNRRREFIKQAVQHRHALGGEPNPDFAEQPVRYGAGHSSY